MAFTFWQRFYPSLILSSLAWASIGYWAYTNTDPEMQLGLWIMAGLVGVSLLVMLICAAIDQAKFRIGLNRMRRFREQAARGAYTDRIRL